MNTRQSQTGIAMIEVLITIIVVSFGFLSLLNMQLNMLSTSSASSQNFLASSLAHDMGERIRANKPDLLNYDGLKTSTFSTDCENTVCTMAQEDFFQWKSSISDSSQSLLNGQGEIAASGGVATISLSWTEKKMKKAAQQVSYSLQVSVE